MQRYSFLYPRLQSNSRWWFLGPRKAKNNSWILPRKNRIVENTVNAWELEQIFFFICAAWKLEDFRRCPHSSSTVLPQVHLGDSLVGHLGKVNSTTSFSQPWNCRTSLYDLSNVTFAFRSHRVIGLCGVQVLQRNWIWALKCGRAFNPRS